MIMIIFEFQESMSTKQKIKLKNPNFDLLINDFIKDLNGKKRSQVSHILHHFRNKNGILFDWMSVSRCRFTECEYYECNFKKYRDKNELNEWEADRDHALDPFVIIVH